MASMLRPSTSRTGLRLLPACLAAVVLGILGMHALAHCPSAIHVMSSGTASMVPAVAGTTTTASHDHAHGAATAVIAMGASEGGGVLDDMVMLCATMLLGAGAVLMLARKHRSASFLALRRLRSRPPRVPLPVISTGPPSVWAFTVIRC